MLLWLAASALFGLYVSTIGSYDKTYGSLGAVIGFMTWMWLSVIVILVGGKLNAEIEHQTARDSTKGGGKPLQLTGDAVPVEITIPSGANTRTSSSVHASLRTVVVSAPSSASSWTRLYVKES